MISKKCHLADSNAVEHETMEWQSNNYFNPYDWAMLGEQFWRLQGRETDQFPDDKSLGRGRSKEFLGA